MNQAIELLREARSMWVEDGSQLALKIDALLAQSSIPENKDVRTLPAVRGAVHPSGAGRYDRDHMADNAAMSGIVIGHVLAVAAEQLGRQIAAEASGTELPPLPEAHNDIVPMDLHYDVFTGEQMQAYARAAIACFCYDERIAERDARIAELELGYMTPEALKKLGDALSAALDLAVTAEATIAERDVRIAELTECLTERRTLKDREIAELRADAERYRTLFANASGYRDSPQQPIWCVTAALDLFTPRKPKKLKKTITFLS